MRSKPEELMASRLTEANKAFDYEGKLVPYIQFYTPDFYIPALKLTIEVKGKLDAVGRRDIRAIARQYANNNEPFIVAVHCVGVHQVRPYVNDRPTGAPTIAGLCLCNWLSKQDIAWFAYSKHISSTDIINYCTLYVQSFSEGIATNT